jgi:hypothetical protein
MDDNMKPQAQTKIPRFLAVKYDEASMALAAALKAKFEDLEHALETHLQGDRELSIALTNLETAHAYVGKAIRNSQIRRVGIGSAEPK